MKKTFLKSMLLLCGLIVGSVTMWGQSDYSAVYSSNVTLPTSGTNAFGCVVRINETGYTGTRLGDSNNGGAASITAPAGTKYIHLHVAAWNGESTSFTYQVGSAAAVTISGITSSSGMTGSSPFTFSGDPSSSSYYKVITLESALASNTLIIFTSSKRAVFWGVNTEAVPVAVTGVSLNKTSITLVKGETATLTKTITPSNATNKNVTWSTDASGVATVSDAGVVTAVAVGSANITVTTEDGGKTASCKITVVNNNMYSLVTSVDDLYDGMKCVILNESSKKAMSMTQNTNNRGQVDVTPNINTTYHILTNPPTTVQEIVLEYLYYNIASPTYGWAFNVGGDADNYLYAASNNYNYLNTATFGIGNTNALSTISFSGNDAVVTFKGNNSHKVIRYYSSGSFFSCYPSGQQQSIQLYKKTYDVSSHVVELAQGEWATFCPSVDVTIPTGINAYYATYADNTLTAVLIENGKIKEGEGVLLKATSGAGSYTFSATTGASRIAANRLMGRVEDLTPKTSYFTYYVFTGTGFARYENTIPANKAYFRVDGAYNPASAPSAIRFEEETSNATDSKAIETSKNVVKFIENGQILIKRGGIVYDAVGRIIRK